jgi:hypothetical protein
MSSRGRVPSTLPLGVQDQLDESEQHGLCQILNLFHAHQRGAAIREFEGLLLRLRTFCESDEAGFSRRSVACGIIWLDPGVIAVHCARLAKLIDRSKSFVNSLLLPLSTTRHKMNKARAIALMARFPILQPETIGSWTLREIPHELHAVQPRVSIQPRPEPELILSGCARVRLPSVYALLEKSGIPAFAQLSETHVNPGIPL